MTPGKPSPEITSRHDDPAELAAMHYTLAALQASPGGTSRMRADRSVG
jgi:hypothetical protein